MTVLVGGEAGVGKSRLVNELVVEARAAGAQALIGGCVELDGGRIPFASLIDVFRALGTEYDADELDGLLGSARAEIGRLVPELKDTRDTTPAAGRDPARLLELILGVIGRLAADRPGRGDPRPAARRRARRLRVRALGGDPAVRRGAPRGGARRRHRPRLPAPVPA